MNIRERFFKANPQYKDIIDNEGFLVGGKLNKFDTWYNRERLKLAEEYEKNSGPIEEIERKYIEYLVENNLYVFDYALMRPLRPDALPEFLKYRDKVIRECGTRIVQGVPSLQLSVDDDGEFRIDGVVQGLEFFQSVMKQDQFNVLMVSGIYGIGKNPHTILDKASYFITFDGGMYRLTRKSILLHHEEIIIQRSNLREFVESSYKELFERWRYNEMKDGKGPESWDKYYEEADKEMEKVLEETGKSPQQLQTSFQ